MTEVAAHPFSASNWTEWLGDAERRLREVYRLSPERLIAEYRREREITRDYHGREILELLQNAADAARALGVRGKVRIVVTPHGLVMGNTGLPFDKRGVQSLQTANLSPKRQREAVVIGDKGLGFRSILNWTHSPLISSGELGVAFVPEYAAEIVGSLEQENDELARRVADERAMAGDLIVPRLAFPQWVEDWPNHDWPEDDRLRSIAAECQSLRREGFDTAVGMPFHTPRAYNEAVQQLDELSPEFLLRWTRSVSLSCGSKVARQRSGPASTPKDGPASIVHVHVAVGLSLDPSDPLSLGVEQSDPTLGGLGFVGCSLLRLALVLLAYSLQLSLVPLTVLGVG